MKRILLLAALAAAPAIAQAPTGPEEKLSHDQIKQTVDAHVADLKACLKENGPVTGRVVIIFGVLPNGHTGDVKIKEASSNGGVDKCVAAGFRKWVFPARKNGPFQGVEYPLVFSAPKAPPPPPQNPEEMKAVEGVINSHMPEVRKCYEDSLLENADIKGEVDIDITIAQAGTVASTKIVNTTVKFPKVENCINGSVQKWVFPKRKDPGNLTITYPFVLKGLEKTK